MTICAPLDSHEQTQMAVLMTLVGLDAGDPLFDEGEEGRQRLQRHLRAS